MKHTCATACYNVPQYTFILLLNICNFRLIDYLTGRSSGQYKPDNPFCMAYVSGMHSGKEILTTTKLIRIP